MRRVVWRIVGMVALGIGGLAVALALTLGALALAGDDIGDVVDSDLDRRTTVMSPSRDDDPTGSTSISASPSPSRDDNGDDHDGSDDGPDDDSSGPGSGSDDSSGPGSGDDSSGSGSDDDSSGPGSGSDDHSDDDD